MQNTTHSKELSGMFIDTIRNDLFRKVKSGPIFNASRNSQRLQGKLYTFDPVITIYLQSVDEFAEPEKIF